MSLFADLFVTLLMEWLSGDNADYTILEGIVDVKYVRNAATMPDGPFLDISTMISAAIR